MAEPPRPVEAAAAAQEATLVEEARVVDAHLSAVTRVLREAVRAEAARLPTPLTPPQMAALRILVAYARDEPGGPGLSLSQLRAGMGLALSTVSGVVARLERRGLIRRAPGTSDRRYTRITITDDVRDWLTHQAPDRRLEPLIAALGRASGAERAAIVAGVALLDRLVAPTPQAARGGPPAGTPR